MGAILVVIGSLIGIWLVLTFLPIWGVKFRFFYPNRKTGKANFDKWLLSGDTSHMSYWKIRRGDVKVQGIHPQKWLDVFRNCGNLQYKVAITFLPF